MRLPCDKEIDIFIRARYPLISVISHEEQRVIKTLAEQAASRDKQLVLWSVTCGIHRQDEPDKVDAVTRDPLAALNYIEKQTYPAIFVFKDFHPFLADHVVVRKLRDLLSNLKNTYETLVLLSPVLNVPVELEKDMAVVEFDLPSKEELGRLLEDIIKVVSNTPDIQVNLNQQIKDQLLDAALGLTLNEAENAFARSIVVDKSLGPEDVGLVLAEKEQLIRKSAILEYYHVDEKLADVGGLDSLKDWLSRRVLAFSEQARAFGLPAPRGILLIGVQGCGKSLVCKAISGMWKLPLLRFDVGKVFGGIIGSSEENMRRAIRAAESIAPAILWIDEIEKAMSGVASSNFSDAGTSARVFSTFLTWLQEKTKPVFVVATANNIPMLPPELLRKGRFDEIFFVDLPEVEERRQVFNIHIAKRGRDPAKYDLDLLCRYSEGFSGAEIEQAVIAGMFDAFFQKKELTTGDIAASLKASVPLSRTMKENITALREWASSRARPASNLNPAACIKQGHGKLEV